MTAFTVGITVTSTDTEAITAALGTIDAQSVALYAAEGITTGVCVVQNGDRDVVAFWVEQTFAEALPDAQATAVVQWPPADEDAFMVAGNVIA